MTDVDAGLSWQKSSLSFSNGNCVEMADLPDGGVAMRDSKHPDEAMLSFSSRADFKAFLENAKSGLFDDYGNLD
jgi:hypothetical protein